MGGGFYYISSTALTMAQVYTDVPEGLTLLVHLRASIQASFVFYSTSGLTPPFL